MYVRNWVTKSDLTAQLVVNIKIVKRPDTLRGVLFFQINLRACGGHCVIDQMAIDITLAFVLLHFVHIN